jgi:hypothetical protein
MEAWLALATIFTIILKSLLIFRLGRCLEMMSEAVGLSLRLVLGLVLRLVLGLFEFLGGLPVDEFLDEEGLPGLAA